MPSGGRVLVAAAAVLAIAPSSARAGDRVAEAWRTVTTSSGPATSEEPPHPETLHEWWYFVVHAPATTACGRWQAMVTFLADREAAADKLLFTAIVDGMALERSLDFPPGSFRRSASDGIVSLALGDSSAVWDGSRWTVDARSGDARLALAIELAAPLWRRRAPEGAGVLEMTFAARARVTGEITIGARTCPATGAAGYDEHVWGSWSRVPMWGVDFLSAHIEGGWSVTARRTPMRGATNLYPFLGVDPDAYWPPVMFLSDGARVLEARDVTFEIEDSTVSDPELGVPLPARYRVTGTVNRCPECDVLLPATVELVVEEPVFAAIYLPTTSSGVLEGWGIATLRVDGGPPAAGTSETELQRFGTRYPH